jgi:hypothetical protein
MRIRDAVPEDAESLVEVAAAVKMRDSADPELGKRGFLIDVSLDQYRYYIANDHALVMEDAGRAELVGFSVLLGPRTMEASGIRAKAERIEASAVPIRDLNPEACAYWEQLAFLPRYAKGIYPGYLAFASLRGAFRRYEHLFGAVASRPVRNLAPLRFLEITGWRRAGWIDEDYPEQGRVRYDVYYLGRPEFERRLREPLVASMEERLRARGVMGD